MRAKSQKLVGRILTFLLVVLALPAQALAQQEGTKIPVPHRR